jgi:hypothetical protein
VGHGLTVSPARLGQVKLLHVSCWSV